jgi:predicted unusual protein kinase regulating ubiquinone biosynthesis (AarF/ABC1/UbiB family)
MILDLSGYYVKSAQIFASKSDFMPGPWIRRLSRLFDQMPPRSVASASIELFHFFFIYTELLL